MEVKEYGRRYILWTACNVRGSKANQTTCGDKLILKWIANRPYLLSFVRSKSTLDLINRHVIDRRFSICFMYFVVRLFHFFSSIVCRAYVFFPFRCYSVLFATALQLSVCFSNMSWYGHIGLNRVILSMRIRIAAKWPIIQVIIKLVAKNEENKSEERWCSPFYDKLNSGIWDMWPDGVNGRKWR